MRETIPVVITYHPGTFSGGIDTMVTNSRILSESNFREHYIYDATMRVRDAAAAQSKYSLFEHSGLLKILGDSMYQVFSLWGREKDPFTISASVNVDEQVLKVYRKTLGHNELHSDPTAPCYPRHEMPAIRLVNSDWLYGISPKDVFHQFLDKGIPPERFVAKTTDELLNSFLYATVDITDHKYPKIDVRSQQREFFCNVIERDDLVRQSSSAAPTNTLA